MVPWVGLQCVIVAFPGHTHLLITALKQSVKILIRFCNAVYHLVITVCLCQIYRTLACVNIHVTCKYE